MRETLRSPCMKQSGLIDARGLNVAGFWIVNNLTGNEVHSSVARRQASNSTRAPKMAGSKAT